MSLVAYDYHFGHELAGLGYEFVYTVVGGDGVDVEEVAVFADYVERLCAN